MATDPATDLATDALEIAGVDAFYGDSHVLHGVSFVLQPGRLLGLLGRTTEALESLNAARATAARYGLAPMVQQLDQMIANLR